jgi:hypothetical protein
MLFEFSWIFYRESEASVRKSSFLCSFLILISFILFLIDCIFYHNVEKRRRVDHLVCYVKEAMNSPVEGLVKILQLHIFFLYSLIHMCIHFWVISHACLSHPPFAPISLASRQNLFCPFLQLCWREDLSNNKKDIAFLLVWDKDS